MQYILTYSKRGLAVCLIALPTMRLFVKVVNEFQLLTIFANTPVISRS